LVRGCHEWGNSIGEKSEKSEKGEKSEKSEQIEQIEKKIKRKNTSQHERTRENTIEHK